MKDYVGHSGGGFVFERESPETHAPLVSNLTEEESLVAQTRALERIAPFQSSMRIVMTGEPGVGKKFHANLLHQRTPSPAQFVEMTAEYSVEAMRAILFDEDRKLVEEMMGERLPTLQGHSLLFVREIAEFSLIQQTLLSRFIIQQQSVQSPECRVIISVTSPWPELVKRKSLIDSLVQSTRSFEVCEIPPLRDRIDEIPSLVQEVLLDLAKRERVECRRVEATTLEKLRGRQWLDNIQELKYVVESAALSSPNGTLDLGASVLDEVERVWEAIRTIQAGKRLLIEQSLAAVEKSIIERALVRHGFDLRKTSRMLSMTEPNLTYRIKKFGIYIPGSKRSNS